MSHLPDDVFRTVIASTPLVSIDLIVRRPDGACLVGWRSNRPAVGFWFVPGGRIQKNETLAIAFARLTRLELGQARELAEGRLLGVYDHIYPDPVFDAAEASSGTHYVVLGVEVAVAEDAVLLLDPTQHAAHRWMTPAEILASPDAHPNTQAYFQNGYGPHLPAIGRR